MARRNGARGGLITTMSPADAGDNGAILIVLGGLPGVGKTTIARALASKSAAVLVRVDAIEHALKQQVGLEHDIGAAGYSVAFAVAASNLLLGNMVVADCVNPVAESRNGWRAIARGLPLLEVEIICSDAAEHRRRVTERVPDIAGFRSPSWPEVVSHHYRTSPRRGYGGHRRRSRRRCDRSRFGGAFSPGLRTGARW